MLKLTQSLLLITLLFSACNNNRQSSEVKEEATVEIQLLNDTLLAMSDRGLTLTNGTSEMLPFVNDSTAILLIAVRHAEKAAEGDDPVLTPAGQARAARLAAILKDCPLNGVYTTQFVRTMKTAQPVASTQQKAIMTYDHKDPEFVPRLLQKQQGKRLLIVGHSNSIPALVNQVLGEQRFEEIDEQDYGNIFIIGVSNKGQSVKVIRARF
ncbi:MAG TPA: phosphoglycerate mutase family protein [Saprospiraceae bacterium]|nr:phosphoglycerate mutase family protein [Saprospiraceae bacterium]HMP25865.1 phosphoglycerate mutase family protein [Saprospiraceae bacterium]